MLLITAGMGCAERVLHPVGGCEGGNPEEVMSLGPHAYARRGSTWKAEGGWLVTVSTHEAHISELTRILEQNRGEIEPATLSLETLWVEPCEPPTVLAQGLSVERPIPLEGTWIGSHVDEGSQVLLEVGETASWTPLPGEGAQYIGVFKGDILAVESSGEVYRWTPGTSPQSREVLEALEGARILGNIGDMPLAVIEPGWRLVTFDLTTGRREVLLEEVREVWSFLGGRFIYAWLPRAPGEFHSPGILFDLERGLEMVIAEAAASYPLHAGGPDATEGWFIVHHGTDIYSPDTVATFLPSLEQVHLQGWWHFASPPDRNVTYLDNAVEGTVRIESGAGGKVEPMASFAASVLVLDPWIYLTESKSEASIPHYRLHRRLKDAPEDALEIIIEDSQWPPRPLADGRWLFFRASEAYGPWDLLLLDPETAETTVLARNVSRLYSATDSHHAPRGRPWTDVAYTTIHAHGSVLWHYRVSPP